MKAADGMLAYYARRAREYDAIYEKPERQEDLARLVALVRGWTAGRRLLELACGTGWWTERVAPVAAHVVATDAAEDVLAVARERTYPRGVVELRCADAMEPARVSGSFDAVLAGFWVSHLPRARVSTFLDAVDERVGAGGRVVLFDNRFVKGSSTAIARTDAAGDTYQRRRLQAGGEYEILKNFYDEEDLDRFLDRRGGERHDLRHYWAAAYEVEA